MYKLMLLTTKDGENWHDVLSRFQLNDAYYLPEYLALFEKERNLDSFIHFGGQGFLCVYGDESNAIIYSFFKRRISDLGFSDRMVNEWYDIISPYGYCGPWMRCQDPSLAEGLWQGFFKGFHDYCVDNKIVSEFARLHPFFDNRVPLSQFSQGSIEKLGQIVYVDLSISENELFDAMLRGHRRHYRRALENSLNFSIDHQEDDARNFYHIYTQTMRRTQAHNKYYFSQNFFATALSKLGKSINFWRVVYNHEIVSGWLILRSDDFAYAWLSGNKEEYFHLFPTNYLVFETMMQLKKEGCKTFILGGGKSVAYDSVFRFKEGFSQLKKDYFVYKKIHLTEEYEKLVNLQSRIYAGNEDYFPKYRANTELQNEEEITSQEEYKNEQSE